MAARVVITLADLETAVPLDRALVASGVESAVAASIDEARSAIRQHENWSATAAGSETFITFPR